MALEALEDRAALLAVVADPVRLRLLEQLAQTGTRCVCNLQTDPPIASNLLSYHLKVLREAGLVTPRSAAAGSTTPSPRTPSTVSPWPSRALSRRPCPLQRAEGTKRRERRQPAADRPRPVGQARPRCGSVGRPLWGERAAVVLARRRRRRPGPRGGSAPGSTSSSTTASRSSSPDLDAPLVSGPRTSVGPLAA